MSYRITLGINEALDIQKSLEALSKDLLELDSEQKIFRIQKYLEKISFEDFFKKIQYWRKNSQELGPLQIGPFYNSDTKLQKTPLSTPEIRPQDSLSLASTSLLVVSQMIGYTFSYKGMKQGGRLFQHIFPIKGHENIQTAASTLTPLDWHTEHSLRKNPPSYLAIFCLRNQTETPTLIGQPNLNLLSKEEKEILSNTQNFINVLDPNTKGAYLSSCQKKISYDAEYIKPINEKTNAAAEKLLKLINNASTSYSQKPGFITVFSNEVSVHARPRFKALFDGSDRWLLRSMISKDPVPCII